MLFNIKSGKLEDISHLKKIEYDDYDVYYAGLIYEKGGIKAGEESINILLEEYRKGEIQFQNIYGAYYLMIVNKAGNESIAFVDNSNMATVFYTDCNVSDDFLKLIDSLEQPKMNNKVVCEYLTLLRGFYFETFVEGIQMFKSSSFYQIREGEIREISKGIGYLEDKSSISSVSEFFKDMAKSLGQTRVVSALTGGYDSRMVVASLYKDLDLDLFISGNNEESNEIKISKMVAQKLNKKLNLIRPDMKKIDKTTILRKSFMESMGRACNNTSGLYRITFFTNKLAEMGYNIILTGDAGDMYKDFWDKQDYPFYYKKHTNLSLFYSFRMEANNNAVFLGKALKDNYSVQKRDILKQMEKYKKNYAVKSYEMLGHIIDWKKNVFACRADGDILAYAPLQELELIKIAYNEPISKRYMNFLQREIITVNAPEVADIITTNGTTASLKKNRIARDILVETNGQIKRIVRGIKRKLFEREKSMAKVMVEDDNDLRDLILSREALQYCKDEGYIAQKVKISDIPITLLYKIIYLYQLGQRVNRFEK